MSSCKKLLHLVIIVTSALLHVFEHNQNMTVFPKCDGIRLHAWFPVGWTAVVMAVAVP